MITLRELKEKAVSKQQQKLMGLALSYKRGETSDAEVSDTVRDLAKSMSTDELEKYAGTKHKGLPQKVDEGKSSSGYELYHRDFSSAMQHAYKHAKAKLGVDVDPDEIDRKVAMGPRKPSKGKTNKYRLLDKDGKKAIQVQVYGMDNGKYELNMYKESVDVNEDKRKGLPPHLRKHFDKEGNPVKKDFKKAKDVTPKGYGPNESVDVNEGFSDSQLAQLKKQYEPLRNKKISLAHNDKLNALINRFSSDKDALGKIYKADIPFVSQSAMVALMLKHNYKAADLNKLTENVTEEMDPTKHVSKKGDMYCVYNKDGEEVAKFDDEEKANAYARKNHDKLMEAVAIDGRTKTFKETMKRLNVRKQKLAEKEAAKKMGPVEIGTDRMRLTYASMTPGQTNGGINELTGTDKALALGALGAVAYGAKKVGDRFNAQKVRDARKKRMDREAEKRQAEKDIQKMKREKEQKMRAKVRLSRMKRKRA